MVTVQQLFASLQTSLSAELQMHRTVVQHPTDKGTAAELNWSGMLSRYLPTRYQVSKASVVDHTGAISDAIDVVVHDRQYSTLVFNEGGVTYVPAESVYAVFEVKQTVNKEFIDYAAAKAATVRRLKRTNAPIVQASGTTEPRELFEIEAGLLTLDSDWTPPLGSAFLLALTQQAENRRLTIGCVLKHGSFDALDDGYRVSADEITLLTFYLSLLKRLQALGTAPAIEFEKYAEFLSK